VSIILSVLVLAPPLIFAITLHEAAHGRMALACGDTTAKVLGRITLNPIKHIDPIGTILVPIALFIISTQSGGFVPIFGWAKPVPVSIGNLRNPHRDQFWVAIAGPLANLLMAFGWYILYLFTKSMEIGLLQIFTQMAYYGVFINIVLMVLNMLPVLPLDGGRVLQSLLSKRLAYKFAITERYGLFAIIFLLFPIINGRSILSLILSPVIQAVSNLL